MSKQNRFFNDISYKGSGLFDRANSIGKYGGLPAGMVQTMGDCVVHAPDWYNSPTLNGSALELGDGSLTDTVHGWEITSAPAGGTAARTAPNSVPVLLQVRTDPGTPADGDSINLSHTHISGAQPPIQFSDPGSVWFETMFAVGGPNGSAQDLTEMAFFIGLAPTVGDTTVLSNSAYFCGFVKQEGPLGPWATADPNALMLVAGTTTSFHLAGLIEIDTGLVLDTAAFSYDTDAASPVVAGGTWIRAAFLAQNRRLLHAFVGTVANDTNVAPVAPPLAHAGTFIVEDDTSNTRLPTLAQLSALHIEVETDEAVQKGIDVAYAYAIGTR